MTIILGIIIIVLLIVLFYLYAQNRALRNAQSKVEGETGLTEELGKLSTGGKELADQLESETTDHQSFESTYYVIKEKITKKKEAIEIINKVLGRNELSNINTNFSKLNKAKPIWWFDIPPLPRDCIAWHNSLCSTGTSCKGDWQR